LETRIFENGTAGFGQTGPTGQRGPLLEMDHFSRKISTWTEAFHLSFDWNFRIMGSIQENLWLVKDGPLQATISDRRRWNTIPPPLFNAALCSKLFWKDM